MRALLAVGAQYGATAGSMGGRMVDPLARVEAIRARIGHPVIDSDGHGIEYLPLVREELRALAGPGAVERFELMVQGARLVRGLDDATRRAQGMMRIPWWGLPAENTEDRATAMFPRLLHERLGAIGIDYAVIYPTYGLMALSAEPDEVRQAACRAFNRYHAEVFEGLGARLAPVALVPMHTPEEALAELDHAVGTLGYRAVLLAGHVLRPLPGENVPRGARWLDTFGAESAHDYDPVWARCEALGVSPTFHSSGMGWGSRASLHHYVFNHLGNFAAAGEAVCRALLLHGVPARFPRLRFAFLEGGVAWAVQLAADLAGHFEKRAGEAVRRYDPARLDRARLRALAARWGAPRVVERLDALDANLHLLSEPDEDPARLDEFAASGAGSAEALVRLFAERFFFGCEADDPLNALASDRALTPFGATFHALFGSDIGHWDAPDIGHVLVEAWEQVERGVLGDDAFRRLVFGSPAAFWCAGNPRFFEGAEGGLAEAVAKEIG
jgi:predicted TIM-barrel fold metal-dependent hydrolase